MLYIKAAEQDYDFFRKLEEKYEDIVVAESKNFDGSNGIVEVFVSLTPVLLPSITLIVHDILSYMKSKHRDDSTDKTEITIEKKDGNGEYRMIIKSSEVADLNEAIAKTVRQINKL